MSSLHQTFPLPFSLSLFFGHPPWHMEIPRQGIESEPELQQCQSLNPHTGLGMDLVPPQRQARSLTHRAQLQRLSSFQRVVPLLTKITRPQGQEALTSHVWNILACVCLPVSDEIPTARPIPCLLSSLNSHGHGSWCHSILSVWKSPGGLDVPFTNPMAVPQSWPQPRTQGCPAQPPSQVQTIPQTGA